MKKLLAVTIVGITIVVVLLFAAQESQSQGALLALPPAVKSPQDDPLTSGKVALGRLVFWDTILSGNKDTACATSSSSMR